MKKKGKDNPLAGKLTKEQYRELLIRVLERCLEDKRKAEAAAEATKRPN